MRRGRIQLRARVLDPGLVAAGEHHLRAAIRQGLHDGQAHTVGAAGD